MRRERQFLEDIVSAADAIAAFIENETSDSFEEHQMVRSAVVHELTVVGEAVAHLSGTASPPSKCPLAGHQGAQKHRNSQLLWNRLGGGVARGKTRRAGIAEPGRRNPSGGVPSLTRACHPLTELKSSAIP